MRHIHLALSALLLLSPVLIGACDRDRAPSVSEDREPTPREIRASDHTTIDSALHSMRDNLRHDIQRDLRRGAAMPALNLASLRVNYSGDPGPLDGGSHGGRITDAAGLNALAEMANSYHHDNLETECKQTASIALMNQGWAHGGEANPGVIALCKEWVDSLIPAPLQAKLNTTFARRRANEISLVSGYLIGRIGSLTSPALSADQERAILYLGHLADQMVGDGPQGEQIQHFAARAAAWRDKQVAAGRITWDMRRELEAREDLSQMEAEGDRNQAISDEITRKKASRTPAQQDSAFREICRATVSEGLVDTAAARAEGCP
jgi:hypothetical protein